MRVVFILIIIILIVLFVLFQLVLKGFKNRQLRHKATPESIGIEFEEVSIPTANSRNLYGWWLKKDSKTPTIILVHGWGRNVEKVLPYIQGLSDTSFNLIAFDARHHGSSDKDEYSTMKKFAEDISCTVDFVLNNPSCENPNIGVVGLSIGGAASIYAASLDSRIKSVVTVGAFANPKTIMLAQMKSNHIPYKPFGWLLFKYLEQKVGFKFEDIAPEKNISTTNAKFMLIHGTADETIPSEDLLSLVAAAKQENLNSWLIPDRGHSDCHYESGFWTRLTAFFNETLARSASGQVKSLI